MNSRDVKLVFCVLWLFIREEIRDIVGIILYNRILELNKRDKLHSCMTCFKIKSYNRYK